MLSSVVSRTIEQVGQLSDQKASTSACAFKTCRFVSERTLEGFTLQEQSKSHYRAADQAQQIIAVPFHKESPAESLT